MYEVSEKSIPIIWQQGLSSYEAKSAVKFSSQDEMNIFIDMLWADPELKGVPRMPVGDNTLIVPAIAEELLRRKLAGKFSIAPVIDPSTLSSEEWSELKKEYR